MSKFANHVDVEGISAPVCRICLSEDDADSLFAPCKCKGHSLFVHRYCLNQWRLTLFSHGYLRSGQKMRCNVCQFVYEVDGSWLAGLLQARVAELTVFAIMVSTFFLGVIWNISHFIVSYNLYGVNNAPGNGSSRVKQMATLLHGSICTQYGPMTIPCLPMSFQPIIPILALLLAAFSILLDGWVLGVMIVRSVPKKLRVFFYLLHILAIWNTGLLMPYEFFDLIQSFLIESIYKAETALVGSIVFLKTLFIHGAWFGLGRQKDDSIDHASSFQASQIASNIAKQIHDSWGMALIRMTYLVVVGAWVYIVKYYYTLILAWSGLRAYSALESSVRNKLARVVGFGFREYRGIR
ncbi:hypothetical protein HDU67_008238 [Dinochytrium kinnereticum]|nr:hypothetical protein HDU67_008238 [Dinochytrium kinnereticum]